MVEIRPRPTGTSASNQLAEYSGGMVFNALRMEDLGTAFEEIARQLKEWRKTVPPA